MTKTSSNTSSSVAAGILGFLSARGQTSLLPTVAQVLDEAAGKSKRADKIVVTTASPLTKEQLMNIRSIVERFLRRNLPIAAAIDRSLIGGFSIRVGDFFLDASVAADVEGIRHMLLS